MKALFRALRALAVLALIQQGPALLAMAVRVPVQFKSVGREFVSADLTGLPAGRYYFSAGRVVNEAAAYINGVPINTGTLTLGAPFEIRDSAHPTRLDIRWSGMSWRRQLFDFPVVTSYGIGNLLQAWRTFNDVYLGMVSALLMLISTFLHARISRAFSKRVRPHVLIGVTALFYSFFLSGISDMFFGFGPGTIIQIYLRIALSAALIYLLGSYSRQSRPLLWAHVPLAFAVALATLYRFSWLIPLYRMEIGAMGVLAFVAGLRLSRATSEMGSCLLAELAIAWSILHAVAISSVWLVGWGSYLSLWTPSFFALLALLDFYLISNEVIGFEAEAISARQSARIAGQVAHDIRSPLAALRALVSQLRVSPEEHQLASLAFERIDGIAKDVLGAYRALPEIRPRTSRLLPIVESSVQEKQLEIAHARQIALDPGEKGSDLYGDVEVGQFKRILSNLLNNAIAATQSGDRILVSLAKEDRYALLVIQDHGIGMTAERLVAIQSRKQFDGLRGHGLGLPHAFSCVESWGGEIEIQSIQGGGTTVTVKLKK